MQELRAAARKVYATDLVDYGCPDSESRVDFLKDLRAPPGAEPIVTNFPFKLANQMVEHALTLVPPVIGLCRTNFLASKRRSRILDDGPLARIHASKGRLPMMPRRGWEAPKAGSQTDYAWLAFERHTPARCRSIECRYPAPPAPMLGCCRDLGRAQDRARDCPHHRGADQAADLPRSSHDRDRQAAPDRELQGIFGRTVPIPAGAPERDVAMNLDQSRTRDLLL